MYRVILLLALLSIGQCDKWWDGGHGNNENNNHDHNHYHHDATRRHKHDHHHDFKHNHHHGTEDHDHGCNYDNDEPHYNHLTVHDYRFEKLSSYVIKADRYSQKFCLRYTNCIVQEMQGPFSYKLVYTLPQSNSADITVKIKHRVLYMYTRPSDAQKSYFDLRILPTTLKTPAAEWIFKENQLTVEIPYDTTLKAQLETEKTCREINDTIITVPDAPLIDVRFRN